MCEVLQKIRCHHGYADVRRWCQGPGLLRRRQRRTFDESDRLQRTSEILSPRYRFLWSDILRQFHVARRLQQGRQVHDVDSGPHITVKHVGMEFLVDRALWNLQAQ